MTTRNLPLILGVLGTTAILGAFAAPMARGRVYAYDDLQTYHLPLRAFYADRLAEGRLPTWLPGIDCGFPVHAEGQVGILHPLHLLLYGALPLSIAFMVEMLFSYPLMQLGTFAFLRRRGLGTAAALFGSLTFTFAPQVFLRFHHVNATAILAHLPWLLLAVDGFLRSERRAGAGLAVGLLTGSMVLLGYPAFTWYVVLGVGTYAARLSREPEARRRLVELAGLGFVGLMVGGVQLLPTVELVGRSVRRLPTEQHGDFTEPGELVVLAHAVAPYLLWFRVPMAAIPLYRAFHYVHEASLYFGAVGPSLLAWLAIRRREVSKGGDLAGWAVRLGGLAVVLCFVRLTPIWAVYRAIPVLGLFRYNVRYAVLLAMAAAVLQAVALADLDAVARSGRRIERRRLWPLAVAPVLGVVVAIAAVRAASATPLLAESLSGRAAIAAGPVLLVAAASLVGLAANGRRWAVAALVGLAAADLGAYSLSYIHDPIVVRTDRVHRATCRIADLVAAVPEPPAGTAGRVVDASGGLTDRFLLRGLKMADGYAGLRPAKALDVRDDPVARRVAGVGAVLVADPDGGPPRWERVADPLPRARLVAEAVVSRAPARTLAAIDPATVAIVSRELGLDGGAPGRASIVLDDGERIAVAVEAPSRQLLVVSESFDPGWSATVDGVPAAVVPVYGDFLGVVAEGGQHFIAFRYEPRSLRDGAIVTAASLAALGAWFLARRRQERPSCGVCG